MSKILFVQGMNTRRGRESIFEEKYFNALRSLLERVVTERGDALPLPERTDMQLLSWVDLVPKEVPPPTKGLIDDFEDQLTAFCRRRMVRLDKDAEYDLTKPAHSAIGRWLRPGIAQAAMYMGGMAAAHVPYAQAPGTLREQVLERFNQMLSRETRIVIGHSLGSVIAYEALRKLSHSVDLLLTVGSPLGTTRFVYERLEGTPPFEWPSVRRWCNVYSARDVFFVSVPELKPLFKGPVQDLCVRHGQIWNPIETHKLPRYFQHPEVGHVLADAWRATLDENSSDARTAR